MKQKTLAYFDCFSGISGDMTLGAFIDLGVPLKWLKTEIAGIPLTGFDIKKDPIFRSGIKAVTVSVESHNDQASRNYADIKALLENSPLSERVKANSLEMFKRLAEAESGVHGCSLDDVHFHEVGGVDAIVDVVGSALCVDYLGIEDIVSSPLPLGSGFVTCRHGKLPVPAPATLAILKDTPVYGSAIAQELVTPTGAAIITTLATSFKVMPRMKVENIGYGSGTREIESQPNLLRIVTGTVDMDCPARQGYLQQDQVTVVETCIDDMNPEFFGFIMGRLFEDGALDVYWIPVFMKKNRPGTMVQALCKPEDRDAIISRILGETTSLGVRYYDTRRSILTREQIEIESSYGPVRVKRIVDPQGRERIVPEYDICQKIALAQNLPVRIVYETISRDAANQYST